MKKRTLSLLMIIPAVLLLTACSKEKTIKRQLTGSWTIAEVITITTVNNGSPTTDTDNSETVTTFEKNGSGTASSGGSGTSPFPNEFIWSNTDEKLTIDDTQNSISVYDILEHSKNKIIISATSSETISGDVYNYDITITMNENKN